MTDTLIPPSSVDLGRRPLALGRVLFVDQVNGLDTNNGIDPGTPFQTITEALTHCLADRGDYIYVLVTADGSEALYPVDIDVAQVHVIGVGRHAPMPLQPINGGGNDCFHLSVDGVEVAGFGFHTTAASARGITTVALMSCWIHHCAFATSAQGDGLISGIGQQGQQIPWWLVEDNIFGSGNNTAVGVTDHCIDADSVGAMIRKNIFYCNPSGDQPCIICTNVEIGAIIDNYFLAPIATNPIVGWAIRLWGGGGPGGGPIANNHATQTGDNTGNNPYLDESTGIIHTSLHGWGMNYSGQAVVAPAIQ